ncbi:MAG TPA: hypothetical protein VF868_02835 [Bacteroidia bacterium]|jgi:hypothetical protein
MKSRVLVILCFLVSLNAFSQKKEKNTDNYTYIKLHITNAEGKILLLKWGNTWEVPGARYSAPYTIDKFVDTLAAEDGIKISNPKLSALFTVEYEDQKKLAVMQYYSASYVSGSLRVPAGCGDIKWFTLTEALEILTFDDMKMVINKIKEDPDIVWGAALYKRTDRQTNQPVISLKEPFYKLN